MTDEQVEALSDKTCIVCREDMTQARKLPCLHAFHSNCLMLWVQNGSNCPTCRKDIIVITIFIIYSLFINLFREIQTIYHKMKIQMFNLMILYYRIRIRI